MRLLVLILLFQADPVSRSWNQPVEPFRIAGNVHYVGASDVTSYLITTPRGHFLIDGGFVETAPMIAANIRRLGFRIEDVELLLSSHAHYDHAGGLAELKRLSGARFVSSRGDVALHARGGLDDPQFRDLYPYPRVYADRLIADGASLTLGGTTLTARITPGHTPGCTTWTMRLPDGRDVAFLCSPTVPPPYVLVGNPRYPDAVDDYRRQFAVLRSLEPEIFLASHGSFFDLQKKIERMRAGEADAFVDPDGYRKFVELSERRFEERVASQRQAR